MKFCVGIKDPVEKCTRLRLVCLFHFLPNVKFTDEHMPIDLYDCDAVKFLITSFYGTIIIHARS